VLRRYTWSQCKSDRSRIEAVVGHRRASGASTDTCDPTTTLQVDLSYYLGIAKRLQDKGLKVTIIEATLSYAIKP
jgi:hypothetical protein